MALIDKVLPGYVATLWCQDDATPTPLTDAQLATWTAQVADIAFACATRRITPAPMVVGDTSRSSWKLTCDSVHT